MEEQMSLLPGTSKAVQSGKSQGYTMAKEATLQIKMDSDLKEQVELLYEI